MLLIEKIAFRGALRAMGTWAAKHPTAAKVGIPAGIIAGGAGIATLARKPHVTARGRENIAKGLTAAGKPRS